MCSYILKVNFFICYILVFVTTESFDRCPESNSETKPVLLRDSLLCQYDSSVRPVVDHQSPLNVTFRMILKYFTYDEVASTINFDTWLTLSWIDQHLTWNPEDHENIKYLHFTVGEIWTPDLAIYNKAADGDDPLDPERNLKCVVTFKGVVNCVPPVHASAMCVPNLSRYPFDTNQCSLKIGSWVHKGEEIFIKTSKVAVSTTDLVSNGEWLSTAHAASIVIPILVVVLLTFTSIALSPLNEDRITLCYVNLIAHFLHIQYISFIIPFKGENTPLINMYSSLTIVFVIRVFQQPFIRTLWTFCIFCVLGFPVKKVFIYSTFYKHSNEKVYWSQIQRPRWLPIGPSFANHPSSKISFYFVERLSLLSGEHHGIGTRFYGGIFGRDSILLAIFALISTFAFRNLMERKTTPPAWISAIISNIICCRVGQMMLPNNYRLEEASHIDEKDDGKVPEINSNRNDWMLFGKLLDQLMFTGYILGYFIMLTSFLP